MQLVNKNTTLRLFKTCVTAHAWTERSLPTSRAVTRLLLPEPAIRVSQHREVKLRVWLTRKLSLIKPLLKSLLRDVMGSITIATAVILLHSYGWKSPKELLSCAVVQLLFHSRPLLVLLRWVAPLSPPVSCADRLPPSSGAPQVAGVTCDLLTWHRAAREGNARLLSHSNVPVPSPCAAVNVATALQQSRWTLGTLLGSDEL